MTTIAKKKQSITVKIYILEMQMVSTVKHLTVTLLCLI